MLKKIKPMRNRMPRNKKAEQGGLPYSLDGKTAILSGLAEKNGDIVLSRMPLGETGHDFAVSYIDGMTDKNALRLSVLPALKNYVPKTQGMPRPVEEAVYVADVQPVNDAEELMKQLYSGRLIMLFDGPDGAWAAELNGGDKRAVSEPKNQRTLTGPQEAFVENLETNTALIRRKLRDERLVVQKADIGGTAQRCVIIYIEGAADPAVISEINRRIAAVSADAVLTAAMLAKFLEDKPNSVFPQVRIAERADTVVACILEGRAAVMVDQSPYALLLPAVALEMFQSEDDYSYAPVQGSFLRILRFIAFFISAALPGLLVAVICYHQELLPIEVIAPLKYFEGRVPVSLPAQAVFLELLLQLLLEAAVRLPSYIGTTVGIVGAVLLGQALSAARVTAAYMLITMTLAALAGFCIPDHYFSVSSRILRLIILLPSLTFGLYGFVLACVMITAHICSLESMGTAYTAPLAPLRIKGLKDTVIRAPARRGKAGRI